MTNELTGQAVNPAGDGGDGADASAPAPVSRRSEIEHVRDTDIGRYFAEGMDRELRDHLKAEVSAVDPDSIDPTEPFDADDARRAMTAAGLEGTSLVQEWERAGGYKANLRNVQRTVGQAVRDLGDRRAQRAFMARFDHEVPASARFAVYAEIAFGPPTFVEPASEDQVKLFASTPEGKKLVSEWGVYAARQVARLRHRFDRIDKRLDEESADALWGWFDALDEATAGRVLRMMVAAR